MGRLLPRARSASMGADGPAGVQQLDGPGYTRRRMFLLPGQRVNERGHLEIGGCDSTELAAACGTPLYVFDEAAIRERCRAYRKAFESRYPAVHVEYAGKA